MPTAGSYDYQRLISGGAAQNQVTPHITERRRQRVDIGVAVQWGRSQPQAFGAALHSWLVDRLDVDPVVLQQLIASGFAEAGVADHHRHDMAR
jgi:hypothetical protein